MSNEEAFLRGALSLCLKEYRDGVKFTFVKGELCCESLIVDVEDVLTYLAEKIEEVQKNGTKTN